MAYRFSKRSESNLRGVHQDLVRVMRRAITITQVDFMVIEGLRSSARQAELYRTGATRTMNSRHLTGHAVDIVPWVDGSIRWDWPLYHRLAPFIKAAAAEERVAIEWGGDWRTFRDGPHWQLPWKSTK